MKVVSPYRPFPPASGQHQKLGPFDWIGALRMLRESVRRSCHCETFALTDVDTTLPVPMIQVETADRCLMRWILEVALRYLESPAFDDDTICISPDTLVTGDLRAYFGGDLGILVRSESKYKHRPILNSVQWWPLASREKLIAFYRQAYAVALSLPASYARWGADCEALRRLVAPIRLGWQNRAGLIVNMHEAQFLFFSLTEQTQEFLDRRGRLWWPVHLPIVDFKGWRKHYMLRFYRQAQAQGWAAA